MEKKGHLWVYIAENSDLIEDGQRPNCRLKINIIIIEDMIGRLTNYRHLGTVHKHLLWGTRYKKVSLNICDLHKGTLKKIWRKKWSRKFKDQGMIAQIKNKNKTKQKPK